jgi:FtsZ-interacting cell division protein ZipA
MNKKKICIGIIIVLILFNVVCYAKAFYNHNKINVAETIDNTISDENVISEDLEDNIVNENQIQEDEIIESCENQEEIKPVETENTDNKQNATEINNNSKTETNNKSTKNNTSTETQKQEQTTYTQEIITPKEPVADKKEENTPTNTNSTTTTVQETNKQPTQERVVTFERNENTINAIKAYLETQGYVGVENDKIVNSTNPFSYSTFNIDGYLGGPKTLQVYARDYIVNGQKQWTQCFIL